MATINSLRLELVNQDHRKHTATFRVTYRLMLGEIKKQNKNNIKCRLMEIHKYIIESISILLLIVFSIGCQQKQPDNGLTGIIPDMPIEMRKIQDSIDQHYLGVTGTGFIGKDEKIGFCEAERSDGGPWKPIDGFKHTMVGYLSLKHGNIKENSDGDIDLYIIPDPSFRWLQFNSLRPRGHYYDAFTLCCEVAMKEPCNLPNCDGVEFLKQIPVSELQYKPIGVYGAWVSDIGHDNSPEIHPVQQIWRTTTTQNGIKEYHLYSMYDNSKRFNDPNDFNNCESPGWIPPPLINTFYISFSIPINTTPTPVMNGSYLREVYTIEMPSSHNINLYPATKSDEVRLDVAGKTRIVVKKISNQYPSVSIPDVWQYGGKLRGFIKIETSVMQPYKEGERSIGGHAFLKITRKQVNIEPGLGI